MKKYLVYLLFLLVFPTHFFSAWLAAPVKKASEMEKGSVRKTVASIKTKALDENIIITWEKIDTEKIQYKVYRSTSVINSKLKLNSAELLTTLPYNQPSFSDTITEKGEYYYAVTTIDENNKENKLLLLEQNYSVEPVSPLKIAEKTEEKIVKEKKEHEAVNFISSYMEKSNIIIEWEDSKAESYNIYRNIHQISNENVLKTSELLDNISKGKQKYIDSKIQAEVNYFYAIINVVNIKENIILIPDSNFTTIPTKFIKPKLKPKKIIKKEKIVKKKIKKEKPQKPVIKKVEKKVKHLKIVKKPKIIKKKPKKVIKKKRINYALWLENSIKKYYLKNNYVKSIKEFNKIIRSKAPKKIKFKAKLFLGRIYYNKRQYKKALNYFAKSKEIYPKESDFWIKNSLKKIK